MLTEYQKAIEVKSWRGVRRGTLLRALSRSYDMYPKILMICLVLGEPTLPAVASEPIMVPDHEIITLKPYVVEGSYAKVVLKIGFRYHMIWNGVKSLTFISVPASWAKVGINVGDRLTRIDGQLVNGLKIREFTHLLKRITSQSSSSFEVESADTGLTRTIEVRVKKGEEGSFTITS